MRWVLLLLVLPGLAGAAELSDRREAADSAPQDYAAQVALARAADEAGEADLALEAWERAVALSGGNLETSRGRAMALLRLGRSGEAQRAARGAAHANPQAAAAWTTLAWTLRHPAPLLPASYGLLEAEGAYLRAASLEPDDPSVRCGLAWTRVARGAPLLARRAFTARRLEDPDDACAAQGVEATPPMLRFGGGFTLSGSLYPDHPYNQGGFNSLFFGGVSLLDLVSVSLAGRVLGIAYDLNAGAGTQDYDQEEFWARVVVQHGGFGGQLLVGVLDRSSSDSTAPVLAWSGWATFGPTLRVEGTWSRYDDGDAGRVGVALRVPILDRLALDGGLDVSALDDGESEITPHVSGHLSALLRLGPFSLEPGFRVGEEIRPVRIDEPTAWNTTSTLEASAFLHGSAALNEHLDLTFAYEVVRLQPADGSDVRHTHVLSVGLAASGSGGLHK